MFMYQVVASPSRSEAAGDRRPTVPALPGRPWAVPGPRSMLMLERSMLMLAWAGDVMAGAGAGWSRARRMSPTSRNNNIYILQLWAQSQ